MSVSGKAMSSLSSANPRSSRAAAQSSCRLSRPRWCSMRLVSRWRAFERRRGFWPNSAPGLPNGCSIRKSASEGADHGAGCAGPVADRSRDRGCGGSARCHLALPAPLNATCRVKNLEIARGVHVLTDTTGPPIEEREPYDLDETLALDQLVATARRARVGPRRHSRCTPILMTPFDELLHHKGMAVKPK